ncbi:MAG: hypothetical protein KBS59_04790 [Clostridiales bacterium]|nr:hypothetical protein [Clostridiales bacterium]
MKIKRIFQTIISLAAVIAALMAVSCGENPMPTGTQYPSGTNSTAPTNSSENTNSTKNTGSTPTTSSQKTDEPIVWKNGYALANPMTSWGGSFELSIDIGSKILTTYRAVYYSKVDGELYRFCFDPLCEHKSFDCTARLLSTTSLDTIAYINNRIYFKTTTNTKGENGCFIFSCTTMATDLRLELTLNENDEMFSDYNFFSNMPFYAGKDSLFFGLINLQSHLDWFRYDVNERKLYNISSKFDKILKENQYANLSAIIDDKIYFYVYDSYAREITERYVTDYSMESFSHTDIEFPSITQIMFKTNSGYYYMEYSPDDNKNFVYMTKEGKKETIVENWNEYSAPLYLIGDYLYYLETNDSRNPKYINPHPLEGYDEPFALWCGCRIHRYNLKTGEDQCVYDNINYDGYEIFYLDDAHFWGNTGMVTGYYKERYHESIRYIMGDIDKDGNFVNVRIVEELE